MLLKRLELQGFKSFADKTVLSFVDGATAVVGPNGSGKSNVSDAIRWVIGETSAKSLRGSNMQDVIFAGTASRKPLNFAEVSLVLDNSTHIFDVDFEEIIVTRRLFRSGESIYQINRANCRLKDIHELFMDTGLGKDGYSIIGQGNVSQILSTKAEDRRSLFEEAAGVAKFKYRKDEATRKLTAVEENLVRINDITTELEGQLNPLKNQSEKARRYLDLYGEYKTLDVNMSLINLEKNTVASSEAEKLYKSVEEELSQLREEESEAEQKISSLYDENKNKDSEKTEENEKLIANEAKIMSIKNDITVSENNVKNSRSNINRIENEIISLTKRNDERAEKIKEYERNIIENENSAQKILARFDEMKSENSGIEKDREETEALIKEKRNVSVECLNEISSKKAEISGIENLRKSFLERREAVETELADFNRDQENTKKEIEGKNKLLIQKKEKVEKLNNSLGEQRKREERLKKELDEINNNGNSMKVEYNSKTSKRRILEGMENDYAGYSRSVKAVLKADELKRLSIYGTISGLVDVKREYVTAIETALGGALQNIVVESEEDAKRAIEYLRRTKEGRATFLPVSSVKGRLLDNTNQVSKCVGYVGIASELVTYDKKYDGIIKSLLGRVVVVDNIDNAIAISRQFGYKFKAVTLEGDILNAGGSMSGGSVNKQSGFLSRATEIKELSREISELTMKIHDNAKKQEELTKDLSLVENQISSYLPMVREYEDEILKLDSMVKHLVQTAQTSGITEENLKNELKDIEKNLSESSDKIAVGLSAVRKLENEADVLRNEIEELDERLNNIVRLRDEKSKGIMDETVKLANLQKEIEVFKSYIKTTEEEIQTSENSIADKKETIKEINNEIKSIGESAKEKEVLAASLEELSVQIKQKLSSIDEQKTKIVDMLKKIQSSNKDLTDKLLNLQQELSRVEAKRVRLNMEKENTINRLWDEYELTISAAEEIKTEVEDTKEAFKRLGELKSKIKSLGSVNVDAIEEYKSVKERYEFLTTQKNDLEESKQNLLKIIDSMEDLMEEHFEEQFNCINESFSQVFTELFGGGKGRLSLSDPDNILESGIEIEVQLPGKGLQNINLYSGGEKSFIAIALLFAILKVKPTPFCILDEIDAALDDVNVSRFATYLKNYIDQTQFIVITHRRGTMEAANILYGVTMQEKGVSKLLSLQIDDVDPELVS